MEEDFDRKPERRIVPETLPARVLVASISAHLRDHYKPDDVVPDRIRQLLSQLDSSK